MPIDEPRSANLANWDERVAGHIEGYRMQRYLDNPNHMSDIVMFDQERLGDLRGKQVLHLQCHIGSDTITLARLGADVTGIDFSPSAIAACRDLFARTGTPGRFVESELYDSPTTLGDQFDMVYTGIGALCWLPDIDGWAAVVDHFTKPGGRLFMTEAHPVAWALDIERDDRLLVLGYPYFEGRMLTWDEDQSYLGDAKLTNTTTNEWNHGLGEIFTALLRRNFSIELFQEHRVLPWQLHGWMEETADGWFRFPEDVRDLAPLAYTLVARKRPAG